MENKNMENNQKYVTILGINISGTSVSELLASVKKNISSSIKFSILTPNPELVLASQKNVDLKNALNSADFSVPDGIGLTQAAKFLSFKDKNPFIIFFQGLLVGGAAFFNKKWLTCGLEPIKGRILFEELIKLANEKGWKIFFLGGKDDEAVIAKLKIENSLKNENCKLKIEAVKGPKLDNSANPITELDRKLEKEAIQKINRFAPQLLFVAFGNPKQEIWIYNNLKYLNVGGAMAVGGTFRYIAGLSTLPPKWMGEIGLEWLWRLVTEPGRVVRIFRAVILFPLKVFCVKFVG